MNIAIFNDNYFPQVNGVVTATMTMARELHARGHKIIMFVPKPGKGVNPEKYPFEVIELPGIPALIYPEFRLTWPFRNSILKKLKTENIELVHFSTPLTVAAAGVWAAKKLGLPVVGHFHTFFATKHYLKVVGMAWVPFLSEIVGFYSDLFYSKCDLVISPAEFTASYIRKGLKIPVKVVPNGVNIEVSNVKSKVIKGNNFLFVGRLSEEKSVEMLIMAMNGLIKDYPDANLILVGDGPARGKLESLTSKCGLKKNVIFKGMIPNYKLIKSGIYDKCIAFVTASKSENQPMTIIEAMAHGLPIIGVDSMGVPEMIDNNGLVCNVDDPQDMYLAMRMLLQLGNLSKKYSKNSKKMYSKYYIKNTVKQIESIFKLVMRRN